MPIQAEQTSGAVRLGRQKHQSRPNKSVGVFGSKARNVNLGRTKQHKCSA